MPPLAERRDDILPLHTHFPSSPVRALASDAERALLNYSLAGKRPRASQRDATRRLLSAERVIRTPRMLTLPAVLPARSDEPALDRATIERVLRRERPHRGARRAPARHVSRQALYRRMEKLGIKESPARQGSQRIR